VFVVARAAERSRRINLPTSKRPHPYRSPVTSPAPTAFRRTIALSPDGRYAALLNQGYGTQETGRDSPLRFSISATISCRIFPDDRLSDVTHQSYFIGLVFSSDGSRLYAIDGLDYLIRREPSQRARATASRLYKFASLAR